MMKTALKNWRKKSRELCIIIIGYVITIIIVSLFISDIQNKILSYSQDNFGNENSRSVIRLHTDAQKNYSYDTMNILRYLGKSGEVDIVRLNTETLIKDKNQANVVITPTYFETNPDWQPLLYKGRNLSSEDCINNNKNIVIGYKAALSLNISVNDKISFYGTAYTVVGIIERKNLTTNFDNVVYMPLGSLPEVYAKKIAAAVTKNDNSNSNTYLNIDLLVRINNSKLKTAIDSLSKAYTKNNFSYEQYSDYIHTVNISDLLTNIMLVCVPMMLVALINVTNISVLWINNRKKELCIKKVLGATEKYIKKSIEIDMIVVAVFSALLAAILQVILWLSVEPIVNTYGYTFNFTLVNLLIAIIVSFVIGYLSSIIPFEKSMEMNPADVLKIE